MRLNSDFVKWGIISIVIMLFSVPSFSQDNEDSLKSDYEEINPYGKKVSGFTIVDSWPMYPGGINGLNQYISINLKYPLEAKNQGLEGKVLVSFIVNTEGEVTQVKIKKSDHPVFNEEAKRVIENMGKWKPAIQKGKPVKVKYEQEVRFIL
ncbi:energy transducer TonB [Salibacter halophilus]|uniref:Energy transducer TonB n=1 Tax=Salibacter halophilus TaxID=1803916 RepID=A0A6N6M910_9FLAO|nr:energy transducer TonB [Salibacter halophilus]KAB1064895.1 energy transducer TonB [Salibacter halophilus]